MTRIERTGLALVAALVTVAAYAAAVSYVQFSDGTQRTTTADLAQQDASYEIASASQAASTTYFVLADGILGGNQTTALTRFDLFTEAARLAYSTFLEHEAATTTSGDGWPIAVAARLVTDGTPDDLGFRYGVVGGADTGRLETARLGLLSMALFTDAVDRFYAEQTSPVVDVATTWVTTGPSFDIGDGASDYVICGSSDWLIDNTTSDAAIRLFNVDGAVAYAEVRAEGEDTNEQLYLSTCWGLAAPAAGTTLRLEYQNYDAAVHDIGNRWLWAIRLDNFEDHFLVTSATGADAGSTGTWVEQLAATHTVNTGGARDWFVLNTCGLVPESAANRTLRRTTYEIDAGGENALAGDGADYEVGNGASDRAMRFLFNTISAVADGVSLNIDADINSGTGTAYQCTDNLLVGMALDDSAPPVDGGDSPFGGPFRGSFGGPF